MTAETFDAVLEAHRARRPFQVFTVVMNGGEQFEVDHPGAFSFRGGIATYIAPGNVLKWFDHESVLHIMSSGAEADTQGRS